MVARVRYGESMPFLGRTQCPQCTAPTWVVQATHWEDEFGAGMREEVRCSGCDIRLIREIGTTLMTVEQHTSWRAQRTLPKAKLRR